MVHRMIFIEIPLKIESHPLLGLKGKTPKQVNQDMKVTLREDAPSNSMVKSGLKLLNDYALFTCNRKTRKIITSSFLYIHQLSRSTQVPITIVQDIGFDLRRLQTNQNCLFYGSSCLTMHSAQWDRSVFRHISVTPLSIILILSPL